MTSNENKLWTKKFYSTFKGLILLLPLIIALFVAFRNGVNSIDVLNDLVNNFVELPLLNGIYNFFNESLINNVNITNSLLYNCVFGLVFYLIFVYLLFFVIDIFVWFIQLAKNLLNGGVKV